MKITIAKRAGFCMGVRRAVDMVLDAANTATGPIVTYGPLIHNPQVLEMLSTRNIRCMETIPRQGDGIVLIRAHGVPPEDVAALTRAGFTVQNATCPRVVRVQEIIDRHAAKGYATLIIGDEKHPEVIGLLGYAAGRGHTITCLEDLAALPVFEHAVVVAQTTQNTAFYDRIKDYCRTHAPHYQVFDTICGSTEKRQNEVRHLARSHEAVLVVGGRDSGNTRRLAQVAAEASAQVIHIEDISELDYAALSQVSSIAITAGASTPNWVITDTCDRVARHFENRKGFRSALAPLQRYLLITNGLLAAGAGSLTYACSVIQGFSQTRVHVAISILYVLSMQVLNNIFSIRSDTYTHPSRADFYRRNRAVMVLLALGSGAAGLYLAFTTGVLSFCILLVMTLLGLSYNLKILPRPGGISRFLRIRDIPGSKTLLITMAWGIVTSVLPAVDNNPQILRMLLALAYAAGIVFARTAFFDILAMQGDRITGRETLPILLGEKKSVSLIRAVLAGVAGLMVLSGFGGMSLLLAFLLAAAPLYMLWLVSAFASKDRAIPIKGYELLMEVSFLLAGFMAVMY